MGKRLTYTRLAAGNLRRRKRQYVPLVIGIVLSIFFVSCGILTASSVVASTAKTQRDDFGNQAGICLNASRSVFAEAESADLVSKRAFARVIGAVKSDDGKYYTAGVYDEAASELSNMQFIEGSYPQYEDEIAMERSTLNKFDLNAEIGDLVTLDLAPVGKSGVIGAGTEKTYVLCGIVEDKVSNMELLFTQTIEIPSVFLCASAQQPQGGGESLVCYFTYPEQNVFNCDKHYLELYNYFNETGLDTGNLLNYGRFGYVINDTGNGVYSAGLFVMFFMLILLCASCLGIINSFITLIGERRRQIGLLRTVGATKRQIIIIFAREALIIALVCTPVGIAASFAAVKLATVVLNTNLQFYPSVAAVAFSALIGIGCVMLAALAPLSGAAKTAPLQAVRNIRSLRKAARKKVKSKKAFNPSRLIARRSLFFNAKTRAAVCAILILSVLFCGYGFSFYSGVSREKYSMSYDYTLNYEQPNPFDCINYSSVRTGFTQAELDAVTALPYVGEIDSALSCKALIPFDSSSDYWKTVLYTNGYSSIYEEPVSFVATLTPDNIDSEMALHIAPEMKALRNYAGFDFVPVQIIALNENAFNKLASCASQGSADIAAVNSGSEVAVIAPREIAFELEFVDDDPYNGYSWGSVQNSDVDDSKEYLKKGSRSLMPGDELDVTVVSTSQEPEDSGVYDPQSEIEADSVYADPSSFSRTDAKVRVGCILDELPEELIDNMAALRYETVTLVTTLSGMQRFYQSGYYGCVCFDLAGECDAKTDKEVYSVLQNIVDSIDGVSDTFSSNYEIEQQQLRQNAKILTVVLSIVILMLAVCACLVNNSITAQIREGRREIGTLRAVGASVRELFSAYTFQVISVLLAGCAAGLSLFSVSYFIAKHAVLAYSNGIYSWQPVFSIWPSFAACAVLVAVCVVNVRLKIRKEMRNSVIDNIREL